MCCRRLWQVSRTAIVAGLTRNERVGAGASAKHGTSPRTGPRPALEKTIVRRRHGVASIANPGRCGLSSVPRHSREPRARLRPPRFRCSEPRGHVVLAHGVKSVGVPEATASTAAMLSPSYRDGMMNMSAAWYTCHTSSLVPKNRTLSPRPRLTASLRSATPASPVSSPTWR